MKMIKKLLILIFLFFWFLNLSATHNRAGEITYVQLSDRSKELLKEVDSVPGIKITFFCRKDGKISMDDSKEG